MVCLSSWPPFYHRCEFCSVLVLGRDVPELHDSKEMTFSYFRVKSVTGPVSNEVKWIEEFIPFQTSIVGSSKL